MQRANYQEFELEFSWAKSGGGYYWGESEVISLVPDVIPPPPYLLDKDYLQPNVLWKPLLDTTLFARFADLESTDEAFLLWANEHGRLTNGEPLTRSELMVITEGKKSDQENIELTESLQFWDLAHKEFSFALMIWELLSGGDVDKLSRIFNWGVGSSGRGYDVGVFLLDRELLNSLVTRNIHAKNVSRDEIPGGIWGIRRLFDESKNSWALDKYNYPDVLGPAQFYLHEIINDMLERYGLLVNLSIDENGAVHKKLRPRCLLAAMWFQFFLLVTGELNMKRCSICGEWEDMAGHRENWTKHKECANRLRVQQHRDRYKKNK